MEKATIKSCFSVLCLFVTFLITLPVHAVPISIDIQARITWIEDDDGYLSAAIGVGDIISGTYTYETDIPDSNTHPDVGDYWHTASPYGVTLNVNDYVFRTDPDNVYFLMELGNDHVGRDFYLFNSYQNLFDLSVPISGPGNFISWSLNDSTSTVLSGTDLPLVPPILSEWDTNILEILSYNSNTSDRFIIRAEVFSAVTSTSTSPVPEPSTMLLLGAGLLGLAGFRKKFKK